MKKRKISIAMAMALLVTTSITANAGGYVDSNCQATVSITASTGTASITTKKVLQPTSKCTITTSTGNTRTGTGTSYGSYSNVTVYRYTNNETVRSAVGRFTYSGSGGTITVNN